MGARAHAEIITSDVSCARLIIAPRPITTLSLLSASTHIHNTYTTCGEEFCCWLFAGHLYVRYYPLVTVTVSKRPDPSATTLFVVKCAFLSLWSTSRCRIKEYGGVCSHVFTSNSATSIIGFKSSRVAGFFIQITFIGLFRFFFPMTTIKRKIRERSKRSFFIL